MSPDSLFSLLQDQLDEYEAERNALLCQNSQAKDEVKNFHFFRKGNNPTLA